MEANFEKATRLRLRFKTDNGILSTEDLWDLPLTSTRSANLNDLAKALNREVKDAGEEDFVNDKTKKDVELELKFEIVKHVIAVKKEEAAAATLRKEKKARKERLLALINEKQDEELSKKTVDELRAELLALEEE